MANKASNAILRAKIEGIITELMVKTTGSMVYLDDSTTVAAKIAEMVTAINDRAKTTDMNTAISTAVSNLRKELMGDKVNEAYDTFTELAAYIESHQEAADALTAAVGNKADKTTVDTIQATINALGSLAKKSTVSETDLDAALKEKVNSAAEGNHSHSNKAVLDDITTAKVNGWDEAATAKHSHDNKAVLDGITETKVTNWDAASSTKHTHDNKAVLDDITGDDVIEWNSKGSIFVSKTEPETLEEGDLWFGLVD